MMEQEIAGKKAQLHTKTCEASAQLQTEMTWETTVAKIWIQVLMAGEQQLESGLFPSQENQH